MTAAKQDQADREADLDLLWGTRPRASRGPRPALSLAEIARAGIAIADAEGPGALSMRRIAEELSFTTMSLYRHVPGKTELLAVMIDTAIGEALPLPEVEGDWRTRLEHWAYQNLALLQRHPWMLVVDTPDAQTGPNTLAWIEAGLRAIADTRLDGGDMLGIVLSVYVYAHGSAQVFSLWSGEDTTAWTPGSPLMERVARDDRFPIFKAIVTSGAFDEGQDTEEAESFAFGLNRLLDGIEAFIDARTPHNE